MIAPKKPTEEDMFRDPMVFRENLKVDVEELKTDLFGPRMADFQREDFVARDPALLWTAGHRSKKPDIVRHFIQRARGHSKTSDTAIDVLWLLLSSLKRLDGICAAEDRDQAKLLRDQMSKVVDLNPWLKKYVTIQKERILNKKNNSEIFFMSSDAMSSYGKTPDFVILDEFTHWTSRAFWTSIFSSFGKREGLFIILCNAGYGKGWQWRVREMARKSSLWHFSGKEGTLAKWLSKDMLAEQRVGLPPGEYERLWENIWQETGGEFVTLEECEACRDPDIIERSKTYADGWTYVASIDYAEKIDRTVATVMHKYEGQIIIDRMDVICPKVTGTRTLVKWVRDWMEHVQVAFGGKHGRVHFVIDPFQMISVIQDFEREGFEIHPFEFQSGAGNWKMALCLRQLILHNKISWYEGCGQILGADGLPYKNKRDDLETELSSLIVKHYLNGKRFRFDHLDDGEHHDDRSYTIAAGALYMIETEDAWGEIGITEPGKFGWDLNKLGV